VYSNNLASYFASSPGSERQKDKSSVVRMENAARNRTPHTCQPTRSSRLVVLAPPSRNPSEQKSILVLFASMANAPKQEFAKYDQATSAYPSNFQLDARDGSLNCLIVQFTGFCVSFALRIAGFAGYLVNGRCGISGELKFRYIR